MSVNTFQNYVVRFSDGRIKIGMTSDFRKRMSYYRQDARKSGVQLAWWAATAFAEKRASLLMERLICNSYKHLALSGAREWIKGDIKVFSSVIRQSEFVRELLAGGQIEKQESWGYWPATGRVGAPK